MVWVFKIESRLKYGKIWNSNYQNQVQALIRHKFDPMVPNRSKVVYDSKSESVLRHSIERQTIDRRRAFIYAQDKIEFLFSCDQFLGLMSAILLPSNVHYEKRLKIMKWNVRPLIRRGSNFSLQHSIDPALDLMPCLQAQCTRVCTILL